MTGIESPAFAAGGGRLLGGLAAPAARALARKATFRRRVARRVRKRAGFSCPWRTYRKWLKTVAAEELAKPVEDVHGPLAEQLDGLLSAASEAWGASDGHLSRALRLVELTYPAIAAALGDADRAAASESWAQQRSVAVRDALLRLAEPGASLSSADLAAVLRRRSEARRAVRLQAFGLDEAALAPHFERLAAPDVPAGGVMVLIGDFGSGKSELAEAWHRAAIEDLAARDDAAFPVWLSAPDLSGGTLETAVERQAGQAWRHGRGAAVAADGVDEMDPATAQTVLDAARTLARSYANVQLLLTTRPGILSPAETENATASLLSEEEALELVEFAGGKSRDTWRWTADMRATVRRPFSALAAGVMLGRDTAPRGEADLVRVLVEDALEKGTERSAVTSAATRSALQGLAVALTRTGRDGLTFSDRQIARSSRLVADGPDGSVLFSLPIFQHWFAAQAIVTGAVAPEEAVADALSFNRWRWAAAVAALSAPDAEALDRLLGTWVAGNPGAAAWVIQQAFGGHREWRTGGDDDLDARTSGGRLLNALRTWADSLGPFATGLLPSPPVQGPVELGVRVSGHRVDVALARSHPAADCVSELPPGVHPFLPEDPDWSAWISGGAPQGDAWPWTMVRNVIAEAMLKKLSNDPHLGAPDGIWAQERRFDLARRLLSRGSLFHGPLPAEDVRRRAAETFELVGWDRHAGISFGGSPTYSGAELEDLVAWIDATAPADVLSHLPEADVPRPGGGWVWDVYSPQRLMEFEAEVYGRACEGYDEALAHWCTIFGSAVLDGLLVHLRCRRVIALLA
ncbi:MAG: NACHT domain-containing protein [Actinomycetes bacterium]